MKRYVINDADNLADLTGRLCNSGHSGHGVLDKRTRLFRFIARGHRNRGHSLGALGRLLDCFGQLVQRGGCLLEGGGLPVSSLRQVLRPSADLLGAPKQRGDWRLEWSA